MAKLEKKIIIHGYILAESGLLIGGSSSAMEIGGTDKQVVRNPINKMPYIPGSSLKGKMRSLIELAYGTIGEEGQGTQDPNHLAAQLFGHIKYKEQKKQQPSRLIVRDGELLNADDLKYTELLYTEVKAENSINRITSEANPRFFERVPKGARFKLSMVLNVFENDANKGKFLDLTYEGLRLLQDDYLGGGGSRGNGQIRFKLEQVLEREPKFYFGDKAGEKNISDKIPTDLK